MKCHVKIFINDPAKPGKPKWASNIYDSTIALHRFREKKNHDNGFSVRVENNSLTNISPGVMTLDFYALNFLLRQV